MMCLEANQWKLRYIKREPMTSRERICWVFYDDDVAANDDLLVKNILSQK